MKTKTIKALGFVEFASDCCHAFRVFLPGSHDSNNGVVIEIITPANPFPRGLSHQILTNSQHRKKTRCFLTLKRVKFPT